MKKNYLDENGDTKSLFVLADGDGTEHYFMPTGAANTYADEDGLLFTLVENTALSPNVCTITDRNHTVKTFRKRSWQAAAANNLSQYKIEYGYDSNERVTSVKEYALGSEQVLGQQMSLSYGSTSTVVRTSGSDDLFATEDDLLTTYAFDREGRTVSCYTTDLNRTTLYGASNGQYVGEENEKAKNNLKASVQTTQQSSNYLINGGFEDSYTTEIPSWSKTGVVETVHSLPYEGQNAARFTLSTSTSLSSISQSMELASGDYSLSLFVNTIETIEHVRIILKAESLADSTHRFVQEIPVNEYYATGSYAFVGLNFQSDYYGGVEPFMISITVSSDIPLLNEQVWVDNVMLSKTTGPAEFDMVTLGHFENDPNLNAPQYYWDCSGIESSEFDIVDSGIPAFSDVLKFDPSLSSYGNIKQVVYQATPQMQVDYVTYGYGDGLNPILFTLSGWGKGTAQGYSLSSYFELQAEIEYFTGPEALLEVETFIFSFDKGSTDWQFLSGSFASNPNKGLINKITVKIIYQCNPGIGYFDNISLVRNSNHSNV